MEVVLVIQDGLAVEEIVMLVQQAIMDLIVLVLFFSSSDFRFNFGVKIK